MRLLEQSTLTNQNITSALLVHTYTTDAPRSLAIRIFLDQIAGNGSYTMFYTVQRGGSGADYESDSRQTFTVPTGITSTVIAINTRFADTGDILKIYVIGLGGDTTTPDIITEVWSDDYLRPTTADRKLDVTATGAAGIDWSNVENPTTTLDLSATSTKALEPTVDGRTLDVAATGEAGLDFNNILDASGGHTLTNITIPNVTLTATTTTLTNAPSDSAGVTTLLSRLTAARAGYLDLLNTYLNSSVAAIKSVVDAIQAKTDNLPSDPADQSILAGAISTAQSAILSDTGAIKAKTDNLPASPAATGAQMDLVAAPNATAITAIQSGLATAANLTTVLNRLGSITGTGVNTLLGYFRALASKTVSLPSDLTSGGLTYDNTTDALEAIRDRGDSAWVGSGGATAAAIADAVWDEVRADHVTAGTFGQGAASVQGNVTGSVASVTGNVGGNVTGNLTGNVSGTVPDSAGTTTLLSRLTSDRADYLDALAGFGETLLNALRALARKDITSADLAGTYDSATDSQEALQEQMTLLNAEPPEELNFTINELEVDE